MNEITHTLGPWRAMPFKVAEGTIYHIINERGIVLFGNYHTGYPTDTDLKGNAQLAAAAPELLAALKSTVVTCCMLQSGFERDHSEYGMLQDIITEAENAIKKAGG